MRHHPLRDLGVLPIFRVLLRHEPFLAQHSTEASHEQEHPKRRREQRTVRRHTRPPKDASGGVDRMANEAIRAGSDETASGWTRSSVKAPTAENDRFISRNSKYSGADTRKPVSFYVPMLVNPSKDSIFCIWFRQFYPGD